MRTESPIASAAAFAISYLPWLGIGAVLSAIAERHSYRKIMILSDLIRLAVMIALAVFGGLPVAGLIGLLFVSALLNPPFDSARSALLPRILQGERYVTALTLQRTAGQFALIAGYAVGAALTAVDAAVRAAAQRRHLRRLRAAGDGAGEGAHAEPHRRQAQQPHAGDRRGLHAWSSAPP